MLQPSFGQIALPPSSGPIRSRRQALSETHELGNARALRGPSSQRTPRQPCIDKRMQAAAALLAELGC